jgi:antitoxin component of RelBE/YafQ-DinJ toxin-antitoxin module
MKKQNKQILLKIDEELKNNFIKKCDENHMKISTRIKYLIKLDVDGKLTIKQ